MKREISLILSPPQAYSQEAYLPIVARKLNVAASNISAVRIIRKSVDARKRNIKVNIQLEVYIGEMPSGPLVKELHLQNVSAKPEVIVIGAGPAGLFASLKLIELGYKPIIIERGKTASLRKQDIQQLEKNCVLNTDSNYCFGEGGAGTFSDGKLYTRVKKKGNINRILEVLYLHGAAQHILYESHPHIGSDKLPEIITNIGQTIQKAGGIMHFNSKISDICVNGGKISHLVTSKNDKISGRAYILATGHSAHDIYYLLHAKGIYSEAKPFAMGVRIEHPQEIIDNIQYHYKNTEYLPAASYNIVEQIENRGVYSFCMCPGGQIVPAVTGHEEMVVNGMSLSKRNSPYANAGMVVQILPGDYIKHQKMEGLAGLKLQELLEQKAFRMINSTLKAPAQRVTDFVSNRSSADLPFCSYNPGVRPSPMHEWLPDYIKMPLQEGFRKFNTKMKGFLTSEAIIVGVESRTSSPVRIPRDPVSGSHIHISNLFPAGEGAGYAGGIVSSAMDGEHIARQCASFINEK